MSDYSNLTLSDLEEIRSLWQTGAGTIDKSTIDALKGSLPDISLDIDVLRGRRGQYGVATVPVGYTI